MMSAARRHGDRAYPPPRRLFRAAASLFLAIALQTAAAGQPDALKAVLLTHDLGDPREPSNAKLAVTLPESSAHLLASARAGDFKVYVYPDHVSEAEGTADRYRAGGLYLWRHKTSLFLDVREIPTQDGEGVAKVKVTFAPGGLDRAVGIADGECRYAADLVDVALAVDVSRSMNYNDPSKRRVTAARTFLEMAREGGGIGRVGLVTFNHHGDVRTPLAPLEESGRILRDLDNVGADGLTNLDAALDLSERMLREAGSRRPVVILLTDGKNEGTHYQNTHRRLAGNGVRIFTVGLTETADHGVLEEMAAASGGMYFRAPSDDDLPEIYARLAAELGKRRLLFGDLLSSASGDGLIPIDATIRRIVAIADGGARVGLTDPHGAETGGGAGRIGGVYVGRPRAGEWRYAWTGAEPGISALGFFGDTRFFLDLFPPQYQGDQVAIGATLAQGGTPFAAGTVWVEPLPGTSGGRIALHDDGLHGDGESGDGVYGATADLPPGYRDQFDVLARADGQLPEAGRFVRQAAGVAIRMPAEPEPEIKRLSLGGDLDYGILFPGETGAADARIEYESKTPENFLFDLSWHDSPTDMPSLFSRVEVVPGNQAFELEITVPGDASPGTYRGLLDVRADDGFGDAKAARLMVGDVEFTHPGAVDLGSVRPGGETNYSFIVHYRADKEADLEISATGDDLLSVVVDRDDLERGTGELRLEIAASALPDAPDGERTGRIVLHAGPGVLEVPVRWRVLAFGGAALDGDIDFGVLFPGETGTAELAVDLDSTRPEQLSFDLVWPETAGSLPGFSAEQLVEPGKQGFSLDVAVPADAPLGPHRGRFLIRAGNGLGDEREARITVGTVVFDNPGSTALGEIRPGESIDLAVRVPYRADKATPVALEHSEGEGLTARLDRDGLAAGEGVLTLTLSAGSRPEDVDGERFGRVRLRAGPTSLEIPVYWNVRGFRGAALGGDVDFGVLFPGETGVAPLSILLDSTRPETLELNLRWPDGVLPAYEASPVLDPGQNAFELELAVPVDAVLGSHQGDISITAENGLGDGRTVKATIGTVALDDPGSGHLGTLRPGETLEKTLIIPFRADKPVPLTSVFSSDASGISVVAPPALEQGEGGMPVTFRVDAAADAVDGERRGVLALHAGPAAREIPVSWTVRGFLGARLDGDIDFGVVFPGEIARAEVPLQLDSTRPETLSLELVWPDAPFLPATRFDALVLPGRQAMEIEAPVAEDAPLGAYEGSFNIDSAAGRGDSRPVRLKIGTVRLIDPGVIELGDVPPGTFVEKTADVSYQADRSADLTVAASGDPTLSAEVPFGVLPEGEGAIPLTLIASAAIGSPDGVRTGTTVLRAGPGFAEVPVRWNVRAYIPPSPEGGPSGDGGRERDISSSLPDPEQVAPVLPDPDAGLYRPEAYLPADEPSGSVRAVDSPLERTRRIIEDAFRRTRDDRPDRFGDAPAGSVRIESDDGDVSGDGWNWGRWGAWWIYLLAALLLLLLLLLLISYILYRLGRSELARLLLVSVLANLIMLAIFIALLSTSAFMGGGERDMVEVNLVESDEPFRHSFQPVIEDLVRPVAEPLETPSDSTAANDAGGSGSANESLLAELAAAAEASGSPLVRPDELPGESEATGELAALGAPMIVTVAMDRTETAPHRRERRVDRSARDLPRIAMPELAEPPPAAVTEAAVRSESAPVVGDRVDLEELVDPGRPSWTGERLGPEARSGDPAQLSLEPLEMDVVAPEPTPTTVEPRGRRRNRSDAPSLSAEPRVRIDDPARDETKSAQSVDAAREPLEADFGVEERRVDASAGGMPALSRWNAGAATPAGSSELLPSGGDMRAVEGVRDSVSEPARQSRRDRQTERDAAAPPLQEPSTLSAAGAAGQGQRPVRPAVGTMRTTSGESRFDAGPGGADDALEGADVPGGDRLGAELADAGKPGSLTGTGDNIAAVGRTGLASTDGKPGGASEPGARGARGKRGDRTGNGDGSRDFGNRDGVGEGARGPGGGANGQTPGGGSATETPGSGGDGGSGSGRGAGSGRGHGSGDHEGRMDDLESFGGSSVPGPAGLRLVEHPASRLDGPEEGSILRVPSPGRTETDWNRDEMRPRRRRGVAPSSSVDSDALLIVVGDFSRLPDAASRNMFGALAERLAPNVDVEERSLNPGDPSLFDCLLGVLDPGEADRWTEAEFLLVGDYLANGGHVWLDSGSRDENDAVMERLTHASGGERRALSADHQLADSGPVDGIFVDGELRAVATLMDWRGGWRRREDGDPRVIRFLGRVVNLFLSGDADVGLSIDIAKGVGGLTTLSPASDIPEMVVGVGLGPRVWENHSSGDAGRWRLASWSDHASLSTVSDGKGGRALRFDLAAADRGRVAAYRTLSPSEDFTGVKRMTVDVYYGGQADAASLSMVFTTAEAGGWTDFESVSHPLRQGWNRVEVRPAADRFRSSLTEWSGYDARPSALDRVGRFGIILSREEKTAGVLLLGRIDAYDE